MKLLAYFNKKEPIMSGMIISAVGPALGYFIVFLSSPFFTKLYTPQQFGRYGTYLSIILTIAPIISGKYESAIIVNNNREESNVIIKLSIIIAILGSLLCLVLSLFCYNTGIVSDRLIFFMPLGILILGIYQIITSISLRDMTYKKVSLCEFSLRCSQIAFQILFGFISMAVYGLMLGFILSIIIASLVAIKPILTHEFLSYKRYEVKSLLRMARCYSSFPLLAAPGVLINALTSLVPVLFIGSIYGAYEVGLYILLTRLFGVSHYLIGQILNNVFFTNAAMELKNECYRKNIVKKMFLGVFIKLLLIVTLLFSITALYGPAIFLLVFNKTWQEAAWYIPILSAVYFFQILAIPFNSFLFALGKQRVFFFRELAWLILLISFFIICWYFKVSMMALMIFYSVVNMIFYLIHIMITWRTVKACNGVSSLKMAEGYKTI